MSHRTNWSRASPHTPSTLDSLFIREPSYETSQHACTFYRYLCLYPVYLPVVSTMLSIFGDECSVVGTYAHVLANTISTSFLFEVNKQSKCLWFLSVSRETPEKRSRSVAMPYHCVNVFPTLNAVYGEYTE